MRANTLAESKATPVTALPASQPVAQIERRFSLQGPLKGDYSLAIVNRCFASALIEAGKQISLRSSESDLLEDSAFLETQLGPRILAADADTNKNDISSVNDWPVPSPRPFGTNVIHCFAWEESIVPLHLALQLSQYDFIGTTASSVTRCLRNSGVTTRVATIGNGVDHIPRPGMGRELRAPDADRPFLFLHVSSCFPRKGIDVLLDAYFAEFSGADNVRLLIKTFDNPHNGDLRQKAVRYRARHPNPPALDLRIEALRGDAYYQLFAEADCLVAPSLGEGFLFPAAEALLNNVPVIATEWGGHLDFCSPESAWLIASRLEKSTSHVTGPGSLWAVPDRDHLRRLMREMTQLPVAERVSRVARGQQLLDREFRWCDVARRYLDALAPVLERRRARKISVGSGQPASGGRHVVLSTFGQRCGIATFAAELLRAAGKEFRIAGVVTEIAEREGAPGDPWPVVPAWRRHSSAVPDAVQAVLGLQPDHVLIEHHPGIMGWDMLSGIVLGLNRRSRVTLELHSTHGLADGAAAAAELRHANRVITHNGSDYIAAAGLFGTEKTSLIPHGIGPPLPARPHRETRDPGNTTRLASFGIAGPHKGFHKVVDAVALLRQSGLDVSYHVFTSLHPGDCAARRYLSYCIERAAELGLVEAFSLDMQFHPIDELLVRLGACDIGVMAYDDDVAEGASGAARVMLRANLPLVLTRSAIFEEFHRIAVSVPAKGLALARGIRALVLSPERQREVLRRQAAFAAATTWEKVARMVFGGYRDY